MSRKFTHNLLSLCFYRKGQDRPLTGAKVSLDLHLPKPQTDEADSSSLLATSMVIKNLFQMKFSSDLVDKRAKDICVARSLITNVPQFSCFQHFFNSLSSSSPFSPSLILPFARPLSEMDISI